MTPPPTVPAMMYICRLEAAPLVTETAVGEILLEDDEDVVDVSPVKMTK